MKRSKRAKSLPPVFVTKEVAEAYENGTEAEFIALYQPTTLQSGEYRTARVFAAVRF